MALTHTDTGAHPRQSGFRPRGSPAPPLDPLKANIHLTIRDQSLRMMKPHFECLQWSTFAAPFSSWASYALPLPVGWGSFGL